MIRQSLPQTKAATFAVLETDAGNQDLPLPVGSGFFLSSDGLFLTCAHVIRGRRLSDILISQDLGPDSLGFKSFGDSPKLEAEWPAFDLALLRFDYTRVPFWAIDSNAGYPRPAACLESVMEGTPVYAYGYPLSSATTPREKQTDVGFLYSSQVSLTPRATSAIVSSIVEGSKPPGADQRPDIYVLDRTFHKGNSGGPVVEVETGEVIGVVARTLDVHFHQPATHTQEAHQVRLPSQFGVSVSLTNISEDLRRMGIAT